MASSRRVGNDVISQPPLSAQLCSAVLWAVAVRADVLFGVEQPNEQQAEVRNVAPTALPSDYHTKTYLCVCVYSSISSSECVCASRSPHIAAGKSCLFASRTHMHTHSQRGTSVMRSEESKSKRPQRCTLSGVKREKKGGREGSEGWENKEGKMEGWCRCPQTAWELLTSPLQD